MFEKRHIYGAEVLWGLLGTIIANIAFAMVAFIFSVSSESIFLPTLLFFVPAVSVIGVHAGLLNQIIHLKSYMPLVIGFISMLFAILGSFYVESLLFEPSKSLSMLFMNSFAIMFGLGFQWIFVGVIWGWMHSFQKSNDKL